MVTDAFKTQSMIPLNQAEILKQQLDQAPDRGKGCRTQLASQWYRIAYTRKNEGGFGNGNGG